MEKQYTLTSEHIALCNLLKSCHITTSGGEAKQLIAAGLISVDGQVETRKTCKIRAGQTVSGQDFIIHVS